MLRAIWSQWLFKAGLIGLVLGTGPLVVIAVVDPKSNPIGPGLLAFFTFWPSVILACIGIARGLGSHARGPRREVGAPEESGARTHKRAA